MAARDTKKCKVSGAVSQSQNFCPLCVEQEPVNGSVDIAEVVLPLGCPE